MSTKHWTNERETVFDGMAEFWESLTASGSEEPIRELLETYPPEGKTVLDVGAGTGALVRIGLQAGARQWVACDISSGMLKILASKFPREVDEEKLRLLHSDAAALPLNEGTVDLVICHQVYPHFPHPLEVLRELRRTVSRGGRIVINHPGGRDMVNRIHQGSPNPLLRTDLLPPASEVLPLLESVGFEIESAEDSESLYRIAARAL